jgi:hypothetical protein
MLKQLHKNNSKEKKQKKKNKNTNSNMLGTITNSYQLDFVLLKGTERDGPTLNADWCVPASGAVASAQHGLHIT